MDLKLGFFNCWEAEVCWPDTKIMLNRVCLICMMYRRGEGLWEGRWYSTIWVLSNPGIHYSSTWTVRLKWSFVWIISSSFHVLSLEHWFYNDISENNEKSILTIRRSQFLLILSTFWIHLNEMLRFFDACRSFREHQLNSILTSFWDWR